MTPKQIFDLIQSRWPETIDLSSADFQSEEYLMCVELNEAYERVAEMNMKGGLYNEAGNWPFVQAVGTLARQTLRAGGTSLSIQDVSYDLFLKNLKEQLEDESWAEIKKQFEEQNSDWRTFLGET